MSSRVVLVENHTIVRLGLRQLLEKVGATVVADVGTGPEGLHALEVHDADLLTVGLDLPGMSGFEVVSRALAAKSNLGVLVLTRYENEAMAARAFRAGAHGYLTKRASLTDLAAAFQAVRDRRRWVSPRLSEPRIRALLTLPDPSPVARLTPRQREVLKLIAQGLTTPDIAASLGISPNTVEAHRGHIISRVGVRDVAGLTRLAIAEGLVRP